MAELKNNFLQGKMNQDLDERILPKGQYRTAMNIQVSSSDEDSVGTAENILPNQSFSNIASVHPTCRCVGSIADPLTNSIYWFVRCQDRDAIVRYSQDSDTSEIIVADLGRARANYVGEFRSAPPVPFLNFTGEQITAISIVDNYLFFTDGNSEPKRIDLSKDYTNYGLGENGVNLGTNQSFRHHSVFRANGQEHGFLQERHITVIKEKPTKAPLVRFTSSVNNPEKSIFEKQIPRFCIRYRYDDNQVSAFGPFSQPVFNAAFLEEQDYNVNFYSDTEYYNTAMLNYISSIELYNFVLQDTPEDVAEIELLYKNEDSTVVYSIAKITRDQEEWSQLGSLYTQLQIEQPETVGIRADIATGSYTINSENITAAIAEDQLLRVYDNVPRKAKAQEIVGNRVVYGNYTQNYDLDQAVILDANYEHNYYDPTLVNYSNRFFNQPYRTIKSQRKYQIGLLFGDMYGRETPIFTSKQGSVNVDWFYNGQENDQLFDDKNATLSNRLLASVDPQTIPSWASYYKFYVKETSGNYFNLLNDRIYIPYRHSEFENKENHIYLAFASKDRSKVSEEDYIILKTILKSPAPYQVGQDNKYKIIDISNEAPEAIAYKFYDLGSVVNNENSLTETGGLFTQGGIGDTSQRIDRETDTIIISKAFWQALEQDGSALTNSEGGAIESSNKVENLYMSWIVGDFQSVKYKIANIRISGDNYVIKLSSRISQADATIASVGGVDSEGEMVISDNIADGLIFKIQRKDRFSNENFSGSFFVKIAADDLINNELVNLGSNVSILDSISGQTNIYAWLDQASSQHSLTQISNAENAADINSVYGGSATTPEDIHGGDGITNTAAEWEVMLASNTGFGSGDGKFFIDGMYMAATASPYNNVNHYASDSAQGWIGFDAIKYPRPMWKKVTDYSYTSSYNYEGGQSTQMKHRRLRDKKQYAWVFGGSYTAPTGEFVETETFFGMGGNLTESGPILQARRGHITTSAGSFNTSALENAGYTDGDYTNSYVNGVDPIIEAGSDHTGEPSEGQGYKRWVNSKYSFPRNPDDTYEEGGFYMHLSFLGPGVDLFTEAAEYPTKINLIGPDSLGKHLQGIFGGGAFTKQDGSVFNSNSLENVIELQGAYFNDSYDSGYVGGWGVRREPVAWSAYPAPQNMSSAPGEVQLIGFNSSYTEANNKQFDPTYGAENPIGVQDILDKIQVNGRFRFSEDSDNEVYTILGVEKKHVYNHTPWRKRMEWDGDNWVAGGDSVEEAIIAWADAHCVADHTTENLGNAVINRDYVSTQPNVGTGYNDEFQDVLDKLTAFGSRSNRRVVYVLKLDKDPRESSFNPIAQANTGSIEVDNNASFIEFIDPTSKSYTSEVTTNKAIFETEPQDSADIDIYYEASDAIPVSLGSDLIHNYLPVGSKVEIIDFDDALNDSGDKVLRTVFPIFNQETNVFEAQIQVRGFNEQVIGFNENSASTGEALDYTGVRLRVVKPDGSYSDFTISSTLGAVNNFISTFNIVLDHSLFQGLNFYNAFSFGSGVESDTVRDDFNGNRITTGARASTTLDEPYAEETRENGLIFSGIYNSNGRINNLNQFIQAQKITKDLNPTYGSIQKLFQRQTDLVVFCEDRVVKVLANKDAIFNADGNPQLVANENVLGQVRPFVGDYGIATNPESFASESYRAYFTDRQKQKVLRLSMDGLTPISDAGMKDWFRDNLQFTNILCLGTYDENKKEYNLTLRNAINANVIQNAFFEEALPLIETFTGEELVQNPNFNGGEDFTTVDFVGDIFETEQDLIGGFNSDLDTTVTVNYWPELTIGSIFEGVDIPPQEGQDSVFAFNTGSWTNGWSNNYFDGPDPSLLTNQFGGTMNFTGINQNPFVSNNDNGPGTGGYTSAMFPRCTAYGTGITASTIDLTQAYHFTYEDETSANGVSSAPFNIGSPEHPVQHVGLVFSIPSGEVTANNVATYILPYTRLSYSSWSRGLPYSVGNWINNPANINDVDYSSADNMTMFNGEEIKITFKVKADYQGNVPCRFRLQLIDGNAGNVIPNEYVQVQAVEEGTNGTDAADALPYGSIRSIQHYGGEELNYGSDSFDFTSSAVGDRKGFQTSTTIDFEKIGAGENLDFDDLGDDGWFTFSAWFKFQNGYEESIVVNDLKARLYYMHNSDGIESTSSTEYSQVVIDYFIIKKYYRLEEPQITQVGAEINIPPVPEENIPAWTEVIYNGFDDWNTNTWQGNVVASNAAGVNFGPQVLGGVQSVILPNGTTYSYNAPTSSGNQFTPDPLNPPIGNAVISTTHPQTGLPYTTVTYDLQGSNSGVLFSPTPGSPASITQFLDDAEYDRTIKKGNWYLVEAVVDPTNPINSWYYDANPALMLRTQAIVGDVDTNMAQINQALGISHEDINNPNFENYPLYHFGQIWLQSFGADSNAPKRMELMPTTRSWYGEEVPILMAIFQAGEDSNEFTLQCVKATAASDEQLLLDSIKIYDITQTASMLEPTSWDIQPAGYQQPHALPQLVSEFFPDANAEVYYKGGQVNWNSTGDGSFYYLTQGSSDNAINEFEVSQAGYVMTFEITSHIDFPGEDPQGRLIAQVRNFVGDQNFGFIAIIDNPVVGIYTIEFNYDGSTPTVISQPEGSEVTINNPPTTTSSAFGFVASPSQGFFGGLKNISVYDQTTLFSGGALGSWSFLEGVQWNESEENIQFTDAEGINNTLGIIAAMQNIGELATDSAYGLEFTVVNPFNIPLNYYYFNPQGQGFFGTVSASTDVNVQHVIGEQSLLPDYQGSLVNALVFYIDDNEELLEITTQNQDGEDQTEIVEAFLTIDNVYLNQLPAIGFNPSTISYSEDVKGWVSFKSFIPESGLSLGSNYYTFNLAGLYRHHIETIAGYNQFYGRPRVNSEITFIFNDATSISKEFQTVAYEGSRARRQRFSTRDGLTETITPDNLFLSANGGFSPGWFVSNIQTDLQRGSIPNFIKKEGKYHNYITGANVDFRNSDDIGRLNVQGLGFATTVVVT